MALGFFFVKVLAPATAAHENIPAGPDSTFPRRDVPDHILTHVYIILGVALGAFSSALFLSVLGCKSLLDYAGALKRGISIVDCSQYLQWRTDTVVSWHSELAMQLPMFLVQVDLVLLGYAISVSIFFAGRPVASVGIGLTAFGFLFSTREGRSDLKDVICAKLAYATKGCPRSICT